MNRLCFLLLAAPSAGCSYLEQRGQDTLDMFRLQGSVGFGAHAYANPGELAHLGAGAVAGAKFGTDYARMQASDDGAEYSLVPGAADFHSLRFCEEHHKQGHRCKILLPAVTSEGYAKKPLHWFDLEAGAHVLVLGVHVGFSLGEFVDWLLGWFKFSDEWSWLDLGGDDGLERRKRRTVWSRVNSDPR